MKYIAEVKVMPLKNLLDPQGKAIKHTLHDLGYKSVLNVRMGKNIQIEIEAGSEEEARKKIDEISQKVLINPIVETYSYTIEEISR